MSSQYNDPAWTLSEWESHQRCLERRTERAHARSRETGFLECGLILVALGLLADFAWIAWGLIT